MVSKTGLTGHYCKTWKLSFFYLFFLLYKNVFFVFILKKDVYTIGKKIISFPMCVDVQAI